MNPIGTWRIHLGAHKTATTHLQETLAASRGVLGGQGIDFIPLPELREAWLSNHLLRAARLRGWPARLHRQAARRRIAELVEPLRKGGDTLVLSEENLLGSVAGVFGGTFYPGAERIVRLFRCLEATGRVSFHLAIRSPETLLPSAYVQLLRHQPPPPGGFAAIRARARAQPPRWSELIRRLRRASGGCPIVVWRYEDYRERRGTIFESLCGIEAPDLPDPPIPARTRRVCADAVAEAESLPADIPLMERRRRVQAIFAASPPEAPPFAPFDRAERALFAESYRRDLDELAAAAPARLPAALGRAAAWARPYSFRI